MNARYFGHGSLTRPRDSSAFLAAWLTVFDVNQAVNHSRRPAHTAIRIICFDGRRSQEPRAAGGSRPAYRMHIGRSGPSSRRYTVTAPLVLDGRTTVRAASPTSSRPSSRRSHQGGVVVLADLAPTRATPCDPCGWRQALLPAAFQPGPESDRAGLRRMPKPSQKRRLELESIVLSSDCSHQERKGRRLFRRRPFVSSISSVRQAASSIPDSAVSVSSESSLSASSVLPRLGPF